MSGASGSIVAPDSLEQDLGRFLRVLREVEQQRPRKREQHYENALAKLKDNVSMLALLLGQNKVLTLHKRVLDTRLELLVKEEQWFRLAYYPMTRISAAPGALPRGPNGEVSFSGLPHPDAWNGAWVERVRQLTTRDFIEIHKQFVTRCALLMPKAETLGPSSPAAQELLQVYDRNKCFMQRAMTLAPAAFALRNQYNAETLQREQFPDTDWLREQLIRIAKFFPTGIMEQSQVIAKDHRSATAALQREYALLLARYNELQLPGTRSHSNSAWTPTSLPSSSDNSSSAPMFSDSGTLSGETDVVSEVDDLLHQMQKNTRKQQQLQKQFLYTIDSIKTDTSALGVLKAALLVYPLILTVADFVEVLLSTDLSGGQHDTNDSSSL